MPAYLSSLLQLAQFFGDQLFQMLHSPLWPSAALRLVMSLPMPMKWDTPVLAVRREK